MSLKPLLLCVLLACAILFTSGCVNPPPDTIPVDQNGDGQVDFLSLDTDGDGLADLGPDGEPLIVPNSQHYSTASTTDKVAPEILAWVGAFFGINIVAGIGAWWKLAKPAKLLMNLVMSIQAGRQQLKDSGDITGLKVFDAVQRQLQLPGLITLIMGIKQKTGAVSVTDEPATTAASGD